MFRLLCALPLVLPACAGDQTVSAFADPSATYRLTELDGAPFPARATISFPETGVVRGSAPCNDYSASQSAPYPWLEIGNIRATRLACGATEQETRFFQALSDMAFAEVSGDTILLSNDAGREMLFSRSDADQ